MKSFSYVRHNIDIVRVKDCWGLGNFVIHIQMYDERTHYVRILDCRLRECVTLTTMVLE